MVRVTIPGLGDHKVLPYREDGLFGLGRETEKSVLPNLDFLVSPSATRVTWVNVASSDVRIPASRFPHEEQDRPAIVNWCLE